MSHRKEGDKKYILFVVLLSMFLVTYTLTLSISTPTSANDHIIDEKSTNLKNNNSLVNTTLKLLVNGTQILAGDIYSVEIGQHLNITVFFRDNNSIPLNGAPINITRGGFTYNLSEDIIRNQYGIILNSSDLGISFLTIFAQLDGYQAQTIVLTISVVERATELILFVNGSQYYQSDIIQFEANELINITVFYRDYLTDTHLSGANVELSGINNMDELGSQFNITINSNDLGGSINRLTVFAQLLNYQSKSIEFFIEVVEKFTSIHIFFNGLNVTLDPSIDLTIGGVLNITVKYLDINNQHVPGATIQLIGDFSGVLTENYSFNQYSCLLDSTQLGIGIRLSTLIASKINYQLQVDNLRIDVHRIRTNISGNSIIAIMAGEVIHIEVELTDLDFGGSILDATVTYTWQFGQGNLIDIDSDGIYETNLTSYSVGTYILEITANKGSNYDFQSFQITIIISNPFSVFILSSSADIPDLDGNFFLLWIFSGHANNYSIYVSNSNITQINSSVILQRVQTNNSPYLITGLPDGTYYYVVVAFNDYGNFSSNCIQVIVSLNVEEALIPGYNLFILICIIPIFSVIVIQKQLRNKIREKKH